MVKPAPRSKRRLRSRPMPLTEMSRMVAGHFSSRSPRTAVGSHEVGRPHLWRGATRPSGFRLGETDTAPKVKVCAGMTYLVAFAKTERFKARSGGAACQIASGGML